MKKVVGKSIANLASKYSVTLRTWFLSFYLFKESLKYNVQTLKNPVNSFKICFYLHSVLIGPMTPRVQSVYWDATQKKLMLDRRDFIHGMFFFKPHIIIFDLL